MENGKLDSTSLKELLKNYTGYIREEVLMSGKLGEDCSFVEIGNEVLVLTTDPVTAATKNVGSIAFDINLNDISTSGATPVGIMITLLLPQGSDFNDVKDIMQEIHDKCVENKISILGGHTEITDAVTRTIVSITIIGKGKEEEIITSENLKVGDSLLVSKKLAIEGTYLIYNEFTEQVKNIITKEDKKTIEEFKNQLSVRKEGIAGKNAKVSLMHDVTEGGILGACHEVCEGKGLGCILYEDELPFDEVTLKICKKVGVDPYRLISSGSMLFATSNPKALIEELQKQNIDCTLIGKVTEKDFILIDKNGDEKLIDPPTRDEIYRLFSKN